MLIQEIPVTSIGSLTDISLISSVNEVTWKFSEDYQDDDQQALLLIVVDNKRIRKLRAAYFETI